MFDPFKINDPTCISFSGGRTSAYMLWRVLQSHDMRLPDEAIVCFANTGKEDNATLDFVRDCSVVWNIPITWLEYTSDGNKYKVVDHASASRNGQPFAELVKKRNYLPNPIARFCTSELKVLTIQRYFKAQGINEFEQMLGIRADEKRRVAKLRQGNRTPLVDANVSQSDVQAFWKEQPFDLALSFKDGITNLGNCDLCFLKGQNQILSIIRHAPARAVWWAKQEELIGGTFRKDRPSYAEMMAFAQNQTDMFEIDQESTACFCGD